MDYNKLKELLASLPAKAGQNLQNSNDLIRKQVDVSGKIVDNPEYQLSPEEQAQTDAYNKAMTHAAMGSLSIPGKMGFVAGNELGPSVNTISKLGKIPGGAINRAEQATASSNELLNNALENGVESKLTMPDIQRAQQAQSRAMDFADRLKKQARLSALSKMIK